MKQIYLCLIGFGLIACGDAEQKAEDQAGIQSRLNQLEADFEALAASCVTVDAMNEQTQSFNLLTSRVQELSLQVSQQAVNMDERVSALQSDMANLQAGVIQTDTTWTVGPSVVANFSDLFEAMESLRSMSISPNATLTIQVEDGVYPSHGRSLLLNHPDGARINILGNEENPERVVLSFRDVRTGVEIGQGHHLSRFSGFEILGDPSSTQFGLMAWGLSSINVDNLIVNRWGSTGVWVGWNANLWVTSVGGLEVAYNEANGMGVHTGSFAHARGLYAHDNGSDGLDMNWGSIGYLPNAQFENNGGQGADVNGNASVYLLEAVARSNSGNGFQVANGAFANLITSAAEQNDVNGYQSAYGGLIRAEQSAAHDNSRWGWSTNTYSWMKVTDTTYSGDYGPYSATTKEDEYGRLISR